MARGKVYLIEVLEMSCRNKLMCCCIDELAHIRDDDSPDKSIMKLAPNDQGIVIFSDVGRTDYMYGKKLEKLIRAEQLGKVTKLPLTRNPRTRSDVRMWVWMPDHRKLNAYRKRIRKATPSLWNYKNDPFDGHHIPGYWDW